MGLSVSTHFLADMLENDPEGADWIRAQLAIVNDLLSARGLPRHLEPERFGEVVARPNAGSFPYSFLHYLRRAFARVRCGMPVNPVKRSEDPTRDAMVEAVASQGNVHLLSHSDAEGFYVPVPFDKVIVDDDNRGLARGMLGSTQPASESTPPSSETPIAGATSISSASRRGRTAGGRRPRTHPAVERADGVADAVRGRARVAGQRDDDRLPVIAGSCRLQVTGQLAASDLAALSPVALGRIAEALRGAFASTGGARALPAGEDQDDDEDAGDDELNASDAQPTAL